MNFGSAFFALYFQLMTTFFFRRQYRDIFQNKFIILFWLLFHFCHYIPQSKFMIICWLLSRYCTINFSTVLFFVCFRVSVGKLHHPHRRTEGSCETIFFHTDNSEPVDEKAQLPGRTRDRWCNTNTTHTDYLIHLHTLTKQPHKTRSRANTVRLTHDRSPP